MLILWLKTTYVQLRACCKKQRTGGEWKQSFGDCKNVASSEKKAAANKIDHCSPQPCAHIILMPLFADALIFLQATGNQLKAAKKTVQRITN
jgi:hypothetical protein